ncbi:MAG: class I SAM-dependent rRNA methyltransferase [Acidobacteria bacterium]|nr:MAG: class I SAM-dependent rRNA methyltransferase [Acidobacteriota bacterium]
MTEVKVNRKAAGRVSSGHPWIFSSDIVERDNAAPGAVVKVVNHQGRAIGVAHYSSSSQICLRLLSTEMQEIGREFFARRLAEANNYRRQVVHGEGDRLPALIVDRYGDYLVIQTLDKGMDAAKDWIVSALVDLFAPRGIIARNDVAVRTHEELPLETGVVFGEAPADLTVHMNGLDFRADLLRGQKTGIFLDQRENYAAAARYAHGKALDCFTSTGGFALHLAAKCESVEAVDSSGPALAMAESNRAVNAIAKVTFREADVFEILAAYASARREFSTVVLDPPAFAKSRRNLDAAARGYKDINLRALRLLGPGGILMSCSCSHHVSEAMLLEIIAEAALDSGRELRILERRTQAQDHPVLLTVPETHYLKCIILQVL